MDSPLDADGLLARVQACLDGELNAHRPLLEEVGPEAVGLFDAVCSLIGGGKRLRAAFAYWGYRAAGTTGSDAVVRLGSAMEFFQAAALIHDDVMDDSDVRRGRPAAHRALAAHHTDQAWSGDPDRFGAAGAILAGNLCLTWADALFASCGLPTEEIARARPAFDGMRTQLMGGQFLDVVEAARSWDGLDTRTRLDRATQVIRYKSAKYSVEQPLLIGAMAGGVVPADLAALSRYGLDLGVAFQLRDDLLGVFGDPESTGKPAGDDLREGKHTVLIAHALAGADAGGADLLERSLGDPDLGDTEVARLREAIAGSGAVDAVEAEIARLADAARHALKSAQDLDGTAAAVLDQLIDTTTARSA